MLGFVLPPLEDKLFGSHGADGDLEGTRAMAGVLGSWIVYLATWPEVSPAPVTYYVGAGPLTEGWRQGNAYIEYYILVYS